MTEATGKPMRVLLLGGSTEAFALAEKLTGDARFDATLSFAGRTAATRSVGIPVRAGGFGGVDGLAAYLKEQAIDIVIDATHPFAARISANAKEACEQVGVLRIAIKRPEWRETPGDRWRRFATVEAAIAALPAQSTRVFSALGRQSLGALEAAPQHKYVVRVVDPVEAPQKTTVIAARGPFKTEDDTALFREHGVEIILAKNAGGSAAISKIEAARALGLTVYLIDRPAAVPDGFHSVDEAWIALLAHLDASAKRGV